MSYVTQIGDTQVSNYPDLESTQEEAEESASKRALVEFPLMVKLKQVAQLPTTDDNATSVSRVKQVGREGLGFFIASVLPGFCVDRSESCL